MTLAGASSATYTELLEQNRRFLWNPFTQMKDYLADEPVVIERGEGVKLVDANGAEYYDGNSSLWVNVHGHNRAELNEAIAAQLEKVAHSTLLGMANVRAFRGHYSSAEHRGVEVPGIYWHFVDIMWIVVFTAVYVL